MQFLPLDEEGVLVLNADTAVRIALLQSPEYQRQREQLYLSALDVSSERFRFDTQFFGGARSFLTMDGRRRGSNTREIPTADPTGLRIPGSSTKFEVGQR